MKQEPYAPQTNLPSPDLGSRMWAVQTAAQLPRDTTVSVEAIVNDAQKILDFISPPKPVPSSLVPAKSMPIA